MKTKKADLTKDPILWSILVFAVPIFISNAFQQLYNTADTMIVGNVLGDKSLAAIGAAGAVYELLVGFSVGVGNGFSLVIGRYYGAGDEDMVKRSAAGSMVIGAGIVLGIMAASMLGMKPLLILLDTPSNIFEETYSYIIIIAMFAGVMFLYNLLSGCLRAIGNSLMPLIFLIISSVINVGLDLIFLKQFRMEVQGTAVATVIAQAVSSILCMLYIYKKAPILVPGRKHFKIEGNLYGELAGQGISMGCMVAIVSAGTISLQKSINGFGYLIIAGHTTARKINSFCMMPCSALALAISNFVSQNFGAGKKDRILKVIKIGSAASIIWGAAAAVIMLLSAEKLAALISGSSQPEVLRNAAKYLMINAPFYSVLGILLILRNSLQGIGKKVVPLISSGIEFFGKIIFVIACIPVLGYFGVILCEPVIWCFMCVQLPLAFYRDPYITGGRGNVVKF